MMERVPTIAEKPAEFYPVHLKKVLKTYQKSAIKSLRGPSAVLSTETLTVKKDASCGGSSVSESSPELSLGTTSTPTPPLPTQAPIPQVPILSTSDQTAELSETLIEGHRISCFVIGGEKRISFVQLLSTVLNGTSMKSINDIVSHLFINFSQCNSDQLSALKAKGLLPLETPTCGLVTKPDAERLCSVLLHEGGVPPEGIDKQAAFLIYHECFSGAKGLIYYEYYSEKSWCVQCFVCHRIFAPQMFVCHSCYLDKKRNVITTCIETGICHWGFDSLHWRLYLHVVEEQPEYERYTKILETFKKQHRRSESFSVKRRQPFSADLLSDADRARMAAGEAMAATTSKIELRGEEEEEEEERWYLKKKAKVIEHTTIEDGSCPTVVHSYYPFPHPYYNFCETWVRNANATYLPNPWPSYSPKTYFMATESASFHAQEPPTLVHPDRVVPLSQSEHFERSYQPNVALAPPTKTSDGATPPSKPKGSVIQAQSDIGSPRSATEDAASSPTSSRLGKESQSEMTKRPHEKAQSPQPSPAASPPPPTSRSPASPPAEPSQDNGVNSVVDQVAAVLDALSDAEDAVRQRVINLVEQLTRKIDHSEKEKQKCEEEVTRLKMRLSALEGGTKRRFLMSATTRHERGLMENQPPAAAAAAAAAAAEDEDASSRPPSPSIVNNSASYVYSSSNRNANTPGISPKQPICSPVSVITSPPPSLSVIRSESAA